MYKYLGHHIVAISCRPSALKYVSSLCLQIQEHVSVEAIPIGVFERLQLQVQLDIVNVPWIWDLIIARCLIQSCSLLSLDESNNVFVFLCFFI